MTTITLEQAQLDLPRLVERALGGEEVVIVVGGKRIKLVPSTPARELAEAKFDEETARRRGYGAFAGQFEVPDSFFEPLSDEECGYGPDRGGT